MDGQQRELERLLAEIHKQLALIAGSLQTLATVAKHEHPEAFKRTETQRSRPQPEPAKD